MMFSEKFKKSSLAGACVLISMISCGCSTIASWFEKDPAKVICHITTDATVNPNIDNEATAVTLQLLQLNNPELFNQGQFIDLYTRTAEVLNASLVANTTVNSVLPNSQTTADPLLNDKTTHIAVLAGFSKYDNSNAKAIIPIKNKGDTIELDLNITGLKMELKLKEK